MILYPTHPSALCLCVRLGQCSACLLACLVFTPPHWSVGVFVSLQPLSASRLQCSHFAATHTTLKHPPTPGSVSVTLHATRRPVRPFPTSCSVLVGGIEESILFRSVPCMLLLARWFSHPAVTPPTPQGLPRCAQLSLKTLPCRHGSLGSPC